MIHPSYRDPYDDRDDAFDDRPSKAECDADEHECRPRRKAKVPNWIEEMFAPSGDPPDHPF